MCFQGSGFSGIHEGERTSVSANTSFKSSNVQQLMLKVCDARTVYGVQVELESDVPQPLNHKALAGLELLALPPPCLLRRRQFPLHVHSNLDSYHGCSTVVAAVLAAVVVALACRLRKSSGPNLPTK